MKNMLLIILACTFLLQSCGSKKADHHDKTVFRYNEASGIRTLDPAFAKGQADIWAVNQLFNGLVQLDDQLKVQPCIARNWNVSDDGRTYTFQLRSDVYFHEDPLFGLNKTRSVTASDFLFSFKRLLDPAIASPGSWVFNYVESNGFQVMNDSVFRIHLRQPFPPFLGLLSSTYCSVVPHEIVNHYQKEFRVHPVGTGPFKMKIWVERTNLIFHKNENYFEFENGNRLPYVDAVCISFINDRQSAFMELVKGNLDFQSGIDASYKDELLTRSGKLRDKYRQRFELQKCNYLNTEYLGILVDTTKTVMKNNPLNDLRIRKAINYGFDRKKMITFLRNDIGSPGTNGIIPPGFPDLGAPTVEGYDYNPALTAKLLADAGYPAGKGLPEITMSTTKEYQDLCEFMQGQLAQSGIKIKLEVNQGAAHREMVAQQHLAFFRASWIADYPDPENYLSLFYGPNKAPNGPNYTHFHSPEFDALYAKAAATVNDSLRYVMYAELDQMAMLQSPVIILYYDQVVRLTQQYVEGLGNNAMNLLSVKKVRIKPH